MKITTLRDREPLDDCGDWPGIGTFVPLSVEERDELVAELMAARTRREKIARALRSHQRAHGKLRRKVGRETKSAERSSAEKPGRLRGAWDALMGR